MTAANNVIIEKNYLLSLNKDPNLPQTVINEIAALSNIDELILLMKTKLANLPLNETPTILNKYNAFTLHQDLFDFFSDFYLLKDTDNAWNLLNKQYPIDDSSNTRTLVDIWHEFIYTKNERKSLESLTLLNRFKYLKENEFRHIWFLTGTKGGHRAVYVTENIYDTSTLYKIVSASEVNTTIPINLRTKISNVNGHIYYENLWRYNSNLNITDPNVFSLNGLTVSRKAQHYIINPQWNEQRLLEEMTYAYKNRGVAISHTKDILIHNNIEYQAIYTIYNSKFSDGTKIEIIYRTLAKDPISGQLVKNHISLFSILKP